MLDIQTIPLTSRAPLVAPTSRPELLLSVVVPVYNEEENIEPLVSEIDAALETLDEPWELIVVDDASTDSSRSALERLVAGRPHLRLLALERNSGQSAALAAGFRAARGRWVATLDGDLQNDPADIVPLLEMARGSDWDVVSGVRVERRDSWLRRFSSRLANGVRRRILDDGTSDVGCSLRVCRRGMLTRLPVFNGMHRFLPALMAMQGARLTEVPVNHRPRLHGESKYGVSNRLWRGLLDLFGVYWLKLRAVDGRAVELEGPEGGDADG